MIAHKCFWAVTSGSADDGSSRMYPPLAFSRLSKIAFWESLTPLIKSHNLLVKAGVLSARRGPSWGYNCETVWCSWNASSQDGAEGPLVSLLCTLPFKSSSLRRKLSNARLKINVTSFTILSPSSPCHQWLFWLLRALWRAFSKPAQGRHLVEKGGKTWVILGEGMTWEWPFIVFISFSVTWPLKLIEITGVCGMFRHT